MTQLFLIIWTAFFGFSTDVPTQNQVEEYRGEVNYTIDNTDSNQFKADTNGRDQKGG